MAFDTFDPREKPRAVSGTGVMMEHRVLVSEFGDGQQQRAGDGIPIRREQWTLVWTAIPNAEADLIEDFFKTKGFAISFWYRPVTARPLKRYRFSAFERTHVTGHLDAIRATIKSSLELES